VILLDTNVLSELMRVQSNATVERWFLMHEEECCLSSIAIGELAYGIAKLEIGIRRSKLESQLSEWRIRFAERIHVFDVSDALAYGDILAKARRKGRPMSLPDAQIAAIAVEHSCVLATRNTKDFETTGLQVVNPWL
jgi:predicted nucleic acid-binding protein